MNKSFCAFAVSLFISHSSFAENKWYQDLEPSIGSGTGTLSLSLEEPNESINYDSTNRGYTFFGIGYKGMSFQAKTPRRDSEEERAVRGDSKVTDYQFAFAVTEKLQLELFYQRYQGYYFERAGLTYKVPDLSLSNTGGFLTYVSNPEYTISIFSSPIWEQRKTAGSPYFGFGFNSYDVSGNLEPVSVFSKSQKRLDKLNVDAMTARIGYGKNWIWRNWFAGGAASYDGFVNKAQYSFNGKNENKTDTQSSISIGLAGGYRWTKTKLGVFARTYTWKVKVEDHYLSTSTGLVGIYLSSFF